MLKLKSYISPAGGSVLQSVCQSEGFIEFLFCEMVYSLEFSDFLSQFYLNVISVYALLAVMWRP